jgi:hypothetical protein
MRVKSVLVAAKALEASSRANPITILFETVANFIAAPFFFPEVASGNGWAALLTTSARKTFEFPRESHRILPPGFEQTRFDPEVSLFCRDGGFLTWAAKPSVRKSPNPAMISFLNRTSVTSAPALLSLSDVTYPVRSKFPWRLILPILIGRWARLSGSTGLLRIHREFIFAEGYSGRVFCEQVWRGQSLRIVIASESEGSGCLLAAAALVV